MRRASTRAGPGGLGLALLLVLVAFVPPGPPGLARAGAVAGALPGHAPAAVVGGSPQIRDPSIAGNGDGRVLVTNTDPAAVPNTGLLVNLSGFRLEPFPNESSFQVGVDEVIGPYLVAFGLFQNSPNGAVPFFYVFNNTTGLPIPGWNFTLPFNEVEPGSACDFALTWTRGTTWSLSFNGQPFGFSNATSQVDLKAATASEADSVIFHAIALGIGEVVPSVVDAPTALGVRTAAGWYLPRGANATYRGDPAVAWGLAGRSQDPTLWPGEIRTGTSLVPVANGTTLWSGGPVPFSLALRSEPTVANGSANTVVVATASNASGPMRDVPLAFFDGAGGTFSPPYVTTAVNGTAETRFIVPNVSAVQPDTLGVVPRFLGATARGSAVVQIGPAVRVVLGRSPAADFSPGGDTQFDVTARLPSGAPVAGLVLGLVLEGDGTATPGSNVTDASGNLPITVHASPGAVSLTLRVVVLSGGFWGEVALPLPLQVPPPPWYSVLTPYVPWIALAVVVGVVAALYQRRRLPKSPMRAMPLRHLRPAERPGVPVPPTPVEPADRQP